MRSQKARFLLTLTLILVSFLLSVSLPINSSQAWSKPLRTTLLAEQPLSEYKSRRQKLMEKAKDGIVVIMGEEEDDLGVGAKFRQNDNFMYLTGVEIPTGVLVLVPHSYQGAKEWLFLPAPNKFFDQWTGPRPPINEETAQAFGVEKVASLNDFQKVITEILTSEAFQKSGEKLYTVVPPSPYTKLVREEKFTEQARKIKSTINLNPIAPLLADMRMIKSEPEISMIQRAINITSLAHSEVIKSVKAGIYEYELEGAILGQFYRNGAQRAAFPCIVGSGQNATILHYEKNRKKIDRGDLIVVDIGAEYNYYAADITRTYPANGSFSPRQREIYQLVLDAQTAAVKAFKLGESTMQELDVVARKTMRQSPLKDSKGNPLDQYFPHGLGHFVGMYVHDVGDYSRPLPVGAVITIEPGIYLPDENIGVRIEDDYLVTKNGLVKLSSNIPSDPAEIEKLMAK
ncbi:MAG: aminopeptidase P family protein [Acidobacteria bacterium]|nr:aminopeptidase P family protein [Acidobacteriota bacterium]